MAEGRAAHSTQHSTERSTALDVYHLSARGERYVERIPRQHALACSHLVPQHSCITCAVRSMVQPTITNSSAPLSAQADDNVSILDMCNASLIAEFQPDERLATQFCNEQDFPDQILQRILGDTNLRLNDDGAKLKKQQFHAKLELERRKQERSSVWRQQVEVDLYSSKYAWSNSFSTAV